MTNFSNPDSKLEPIRINPDFYKKYDKPGPRYTSYPPAPHFSADFDAAHWNQLVLDSNKLKDNVSFYFHIPFCPRRCLYCGCTTDTESGKDVFQNYHEMLLKEMDTAMEKLDRGREVSQIHFGGGTPNYFPYDYLNELLDKIKATFSMSKGAEIAIECDPNLLNVEKLKKLRGMGFNRISFGLQDYNLEVLKAVNRKFPKYHPDDFIKDARDLGFRGINLDLIYGLPFQTEESFNDTLQRTMKSNPDRIAIFGYAHVPWQKSHQKELEEMGLPSPDTRIAMAVSAYNTLTSSGYLSIGMDHFAKPDDALSKAMKEGLLHRNFQGYCTRETTGQVYAFGSSGISQLRGGYGQNEKETRAYMERIAKDGSAITKIYTMTDENIFYREVINSLMCRGRLDPEEISALTGMELKSVLSKLSPGMDKLEPYINDSLAEVEGGKLKITQKGWLVVRCIAMLFDPMLESNKGRYSRTV